MPPLLDASACRNLLRSFLAEDIGPGDITTETTVSATQRARGEVIAKAPLVLAGMELFIEVFRLLDLATSAEIFSHDGEELAPGKILGRVNASARGLLTGERVALNLLQRLSGIATLTRRYVCAIEGTGAEILDTRKTTPGLRALEKYAVRVGGGKSHRKDLGEAVLIKENHIRLAGGVSAALTAAQAAKGRAAWIEIEVTNRDELRAALAHNPDVILLDNMSPALVRQAVDEVRKHAGPTKIRTEASGGITLDNVREFAQAGVDWISSGALTHSAPAVDLSFEIEPLV
ncbi:MAG TPA: carboxylating nicotinate-nucleotide diphosphorylase [Candidatus Acidoferrum sp.]|jgi:nicotinate-nucleotide pyrophosphorylase (carboxylating)|nr:carboxylating nicotinate-nucleotide diphosphorylase [Candidatus Acidoferrum sp.]